MAKQEPERSLTGSLLTVALAIYVLVLMTAAVDELFDLGIFPPELERQIAVKLEELRSPDVATRQEAETWLVEEGHQFAVRQLIHELGDPPVRDKVAEILAKICSELDLVAQAKNAVTRMTNRDTKLADEAQWELVELGHFGVPAILDAMGHPDPRLKDRLRRALVQATAMYFDDEPLKAPWKAEKLDARAAELVNQLRNPALADAAGAELKAKPMAHFAMPSLLTGLYDRQTGPKAAQVLAQITKQPDLKGPQWERWYSTWWQEWYKKEKDNLGFGTNYKQWKLWYRMNKDHL